MDKRFYMALLYDFYGEMLTQKQKSVMELYYLNDLSLGEIGEQNETTRQSVFDMIKRTEKSLLQYEEKLGIVDKYLKQKERLEKALNFLDTFEKDEKISELKDMLKQIID